MDNIKRDDGFIVLDEIDYTKQDKSFIFDIDNKKYFFKKIKSLDKIYNELIAEELAKDYGIDNAKYDLASLYGFVGVISEDFIQNRPFIFISELINKNIKDIGLSKYNNLKDLRDILAKEYKNNELFKKLLDIFVFDIIIGNSDRHSDNYGLFLEKNVTFAPLFDNELMLSTSSIYSGIYSIGVTTYDYKPLLDLYTKEDDYIKKAIGKYDIYERLIDKISIVDSSNMKKVLDRVEDRIESKMNETVKEKIVHLMDDNYNNITDKIKKYSLRMG